MVYSLAWGLIMSDVRTVHVRLELEVNKYLPLDEVRRLTQCGVEYLLRVVPTKVVACEDNAKHELEHVFIND